MSTPVLILGKSGSGKSSGLRTLPPNKTFLFNICGKELPFKSARKDFIPLVSGKGNMAITDDYDIIFKTIEWIEKCQPQIEHIVFDDSQYLLVNEFMRKHASKGKGNDIFQLYNDIGDHFWNLLWKTKFLSIDATVYFLHHTETNDSGEIKAKTIGKMLDEKVDIPGMFTCVFLSKKDADKNYFLTQNDGTHPAKTPMGMFTDLKIDNDLLLVHNTIKQYYKGE